MNMYKKMLKYSLIIIGVLAFIRILAGFMAEPQKPAVRLNNECATERVFDNANVLSPQEEDTLSALIAETESLIQADILIVTINEEVQDIMAYADDFYDNGNYGFDKVHGNGVVYVDNWQDGEVWLSTCGNVYERFGSGTINSIIDTVTSQTNANPYKAYKNYVELIADEMGVGGMPGSDISIFVIMIFAAVVTSVFYGINMRKLKGEKTVDSTSYVKDGTSRLAGQQDALISRNVTQRVIQRDNSNGGSGGGFGGGHISGGGVSHGGGGGRH